MTPLIVLRGYVSWHYSRGYGDLWDVLGNILWFLAQFFSFTFLLKTLFAPWRRIDEKRSQGFSLSEFGSVFIVNTVMRLVGFLMRLLVLSIGSVVYLFTFIASGFLLILWAVLPFVIILAVVFGIILLFQ